MAEIDAELLALREGVLALRGARDERSRELHGPQYASVYGEALETMPSPVMVARRCGHVCSNCSGTQPGKGRTR